MRTTVIYLISVIFSTQALGAEVEVFTLNKIDGERSGVTVYVVNEGDRLLNEINQQLASASVTNEEDAERFVTPELTNALTRQVTGLAKAAQYQLKYFPALVIDGRYVIYGTTDPAVYEQVAP